MRGGTGKMPVVRQGGGASWFDLARRARARKMTASQALWMPVKRRSRAAAAMMKREGAGWLGRKREAMARAA